jgi:hypothetical protein
MRLDSRRQISPTRVNSARPESEFALNFTSAATDHMKNSFVRGGSTSVAVASLYMLFAAPTLFGADEVEPEDATVYAGPRVTEVAVGDDPDAPKAVGIFVLPSYRSDVLRGEFVGKRMFVILEGKKVSFWGARVVALDDASPLRKLGLDVGDVVTRLDGVAVDTEKFERNKVWQIPELEKHYGPTEVKWIKQGKHLVHVGEIDLGPAGAATTTALLGPFEIKLLPGFRNQPLQGFDSLPGKLVHADGRAIHYEVGIYYPPGEPRTGGAFENRAIRSAAENRDVVLKQQTIGRADVRRGANRRRSHDQHRFHTEPPGDQLRLHGQDARRSRRRVVNGPEPDGASGRRAAA